MKTNNKYGIKGIGGNLMRVAMSVTIPIEVAVLVDKMVGQPDVKNKSELIVKAIKAYAQTKYKMA